MMENELPKMIGPVSLEERIIALEQEVERMKWNQMYAHEGEPLDADGTLQVLATKYVASTQDGWLRVTSGSAQIALPSGVMVDITNSANGREEGVVKEGYYANKVFSVAAGYTVSTYPRYSELVVKVTRNPNPDGIYDLFVNLSYRDSGVARTAGPFQAFTDRLNPIPTGRTPVEIPDYPHQGGVGYPPVGTVWFHIGSPGARYIHSGTLTAGCLTCKPAHWLQIYEILHKARDTTPNHIGYMVVT